MSGFPSPPSNPSPRVTEEERQERERIERERRQTVALVLLFLEPFINRYPLAALLKNIVEGQNTSDGVEKQYMIAVAINNLMVGQQIDNPRFQDQIVQRFATAARNPGAPLYQALNMPRHFPPITINGPIVFFGWNYARSLQIVHKLLDDEEAHMAAPHH